MPRLREGLKMVEVVSKINVIKKDRFFKMATGYLYDVEIIRSTDGGKNFYFCGCSEFAKTKKEAERIKKRFIKKELKVIE
jgi:hypothetical protein